MNQTSTVIEPMTDTQVRLRRGGGVLRVVEAALLVVAAVLFALHFVHIRADFPNFSPWVDWAKYTDEGWYGDAAIRHYQWGHWNVPGDFNPAAALPVWPLIELVLFRFTGVSLVAVRALAVTVFGLSLVCCYLLMRRWSADADEGRSLAPAVAVLLLAANPFCFVFTREAILEPLMVLLQLAALMVARVAGESVDGQGWRKRLSAGGLGVLLVLLVLTKTTAVFLFPAILWMVWASTGYRSRPFLRTVLGTGSVAAGLWGAYYVLFVRFYLVDYRYLFSANGYTKITADTFWTTLIGAVYAGTWFGTPLFLMALLAAVGVLASAVRRGSRTNPLAVSLVLWIAGYTAFMVYHASIRARYYLVVAIPYTLLAVLWFEPWVMRVVREGRASRGVEIRKLGAVLLVGLVIVAFGLDARSTLGYVRHPEYTFVNAAVGVRDAVRRELALHPGHSPLVLSISGSDISLMTGLPSICDDFGTLELPERVAKYRPGWFAAWNDVEDDKMAALAPLYHVERVAAFPAYDDPERNLLILYRLDPLDTPGPKAAHGRKRYFSVPSHRHSAQASPPKASP